MNIVIPNYYFFAVNLIDESVSKIIDSLPSLMQQRNKIYLTNLKDFTFHLAVNNNIQFRVSWSQLILQQILAETRIDRWYKGEGEC